MKMLMTAPYDNGTLYIDGIEVSFRNGKTEVPLAIGKRILLKGAYNIGLKNEKDLSVAKKILIIREQGLGDVLLVTPLLRKLKKEINPKAAVDWMVKAEYKGLLIGSPYINKIVDINTITDNISNNYEKIIKLNECEFGGDSKQQHRADVFASRVPGIGGIEDKSLDYFITKKDRNFEPPFKKYIVMVLHANCVNRILPKERLKHIANLLVERGYKVVLVDKGSKSGWEAKGVLNTCGKNTIRGAARYIYYSKGVLTPDTGMMHVASALKKKVVAYFGAIDWRLRKTHKDLLPLVSEIKCYPCNGYSCANPLCITRLSDGYIADETVRFIER